jgi:predicted 2-oxoglutarate/Fe(II)-dependent dioxygenase YbiX
VYAGHFDFAVPLIQRIPGLWTAADCDVALAAVGSAPWLAATVNSAEGRIVNERVRNNDLALVRDPALIDRLLVQLRPHLPQTMVAEWDGKRATVALDGLFSPLRVYRYHVGQRFGLHHDQSYRRGDGARSLLTLMIYLDDDFDGGETDFPEQRERVVPVRGDALWFQHALLHAGLPVTRGVKHVLRTDVLYRAVQ